MSYPKMVKVETKDAVAVAVKPGIGLPWDISYPLDHTKSYGTAPQVRKIMQRELERLEAADRDVEVCQS